MTKKETQAGGTPSLEEISRHLLQDERPSAYLSRIFYEPFFQTPPFDLLYRLKATRQSPRHHPEGDVFAHTMLVVDQAALRRRQSKAPLVFMWAALLHDIGKPSTTRLRKGSITSYGHDAEGAALAQAFLRELGGDERFCRGVARLVRWHMQMLYVLKDLPYAAIDEMAAETDLNEIALLCLCDRLGRGGAVKSVEEENYRLFLQKCRKNREENQNDRE